MTTLTSTAAGSSTAQATADFDAVVVGAGFSGMYVLRKLRDELGLSVQGFEAGSGVGGTWNWNRYPGARTDSLYYIYCYSFSPELAQEWVWKERYPSQPEVRSYLRHVAERFDLNRSFRFNTRVESAHFNEEAGLWDVTLSTGDTVTATYIVTAVGLLSAANLPPFKNLESFKGEWHHTYSWPEGGVDLKGKRVGLIGVGSTGVQILPELAAQAAEVTVFQRTPNYVVPARNRPLTAEEQQDIKSRYTDVFQKIRKHPFGMDFDSPGRNALDVDEAERERIYQEAWDKGGFHFLFEAFDDLSINEEANETACEFIRRKIRSIVKDPEVAERLTPYGYPYGSKRPPVGTDYYETYNRDNVTLVDVSADPIVEITEEGVRTKAHEYVFDVIVFATGFDASTGSVTRIDVQGRDGQKLVDKWKDGPLTNMGYSTAGFPNLLMVSGPLSPFANIPVCAEETADWIVHAIDYMRKNDQRFIESTEEAQKAWAEQCTEIANLILAAKGEKVNTWFAGANIEGKAHAINVYFGGVDAYIARGNEVAKNGYEGFVLTT